MANKKPDKIKFAKQALRRASLRWPPRYEAIKLSRIAPNCHVCAECSGKFKRDEIQLDHTDPVKDIKSDDDDLNTFADRLLVDVDCFSVLCKNCHLNKTTLENAMRRHYKTKKRKKK